MYHLIMDHLTPVLDGLILLDGLEYDGDVIVWSPIRRREPPISVQLASCINIVANSGVSDVLPFDGLTTDQGNPKAGNQIIPGLDVMVGQDWILVQLDGFGEL